MSLIQTIITGGVYAQQCIFIWHTTILPLSWLKAKGWCALCLELLWKRQQALVSVPKHSLGDSNYQCLLCFSWLCPEGLITEPRWLEHDVICGQMNLKFFRRENSAGPNGQILFYLEFSFHPLIFISLLISQTNSATVADGGLCDIVKDLSKSNSQSKEKPKGLLFGLRKRVQ